MRVACKSQRSLSLQLKARFFIHTFGFFQIVPNQKLRDSNLSRTAIHDKQLTLVQQLEVVLITSVKTCLNTDSVTYFRTISENVFKIKLKLRKG